MIRPNYYFVAVATEEHLCRCLEVSMAGFPDTYSGLWAYVDINVGDYVTFLHGAWAYNLYRVEKKVFERNYKTDKPWPPIKIRGGQRYFPFRLCLKLVGKFSEPLVRTDFAFIGEDLLTRGGYGKSHFQSDQLTLQNVLGMLRNRRILSLRLRGLAEFGLSLECEERKSDEVSNSDGLEFCWDKKEENPPSKWVVKENILQAAIKRKLAESYLTKLLTWFGLNQSKDEFEILGEKALRRGYIDIVVKEMFPVTVPAQTIVVEVKLGTATNKDLQQIEEYVNQLKSSGGVLIAREFQGLHKKISEKGSRIRFVKYDFSKTNTPCTECVKGFDELVKNLHLEEYKWQ